MSSNNHESAIFRRARAPWEDARAAGNARLSRALKIGALVPMGLLVSGWAVAVGNTGLGNATGQGDAPQVPATALEQPTVERSGVGALDPQAGLDGAIATLSSNGIPTAALNAYRHAETVLAQADPTCRLPWNLVAAIGRVESNHGRIKGNVLSATGVVQPGLTAPAIGPMQLTQATGDQVAIDADNDGVINLQDIDDAATAAGIFLCSGNGDLSTDADARAAVARYGDGADYVESVMKISASYANGTYTQTPDGLSSASILTSMAYDQTLTAAERETARRHEEESEQEDTRNGRNRPGRTTPTPTTTTTTSPSPTGGNDGGGGNHGTSTPPPPNPLEPVGDLVQKTLENTTGTVDQTLRGVTDTVNGTVQGVGETVNQTLNGVGQLLGGQPPR